MGKRKKVVKVLTVTEIRALPDDQIKPEHLDALRAIALTSDGLPIDFDILYRHDPDVAKNIGPRKAVKYDDSADIIAIDAFIESATIPEGYTLRHVGLQRNDDASGKATHRTIMPDVDGKPVIKDGRQGYVPSANGGHGGSRNAVKLIAKDSNGDDQFVKPSPECKTWVGVINGLGHDAVEIVGADSATRVIGYMLTGFKGKNPFSPTIDDADLEPFTVPDEKPSK